MKILVIAPQPFFTPRGTPFSVYYRSLVSAELGADIDLLTYGEGQDVDIPGVRLVRIPQLPLIRNVKVGPSWKKLVLDVLMLCWTIALLLRRRYDAVHAHEEAVFFSRFLKRIFGFKLIYDMHSSLPQQLSNFQFTESKLMIGLFKKLEDSCLRASDVVITICPDLADYVHQVIDDPEKHYLIENSIFSPVQLAGPPPTQEPVAAGSPGHHGKQLIVYAGTLESYQGIDLLIQAYASVAAKFADSHLLIVGGSPDQVAHYSDLAKRLHLDERVSFTGSVDPETARAHSEQAAVLVSPRSAGTNTPLKVYAMLASGKPIVATDIYSHTQVLDHDVAVLVPPTPAGLAGGLASVLRSPDISRRLAANAKALYAAKYSRKVYKRKMAAVFCRLGHCLEQS
jgi:glycosyltransferase involved in cell wall biosynthesis